MPLAMYLYHFARGKEIPRLGGKWNVPKGGVIDWKLLTGAAIFGVGWGLAGVCRTHCFFSWCRRTFNYPWTSSWTRTCELWACPREYRRSALCHGPLACRGGDWRFIGLIVMIVRFPRFSLSPRCSVYSHALLRVILHVRDRKVIRYIYIIAIAITSEIAPLIAL